MTHETGGEALTFYSAPEVQGQLNLTRVELSGIAIEGLLLVLKIRGSDNTPPERRYVAPYVAAVREQMARAGQSGIEAARRIAYSSGHQVNTMIDAFANTAEGHTHGFGRKPAATKALNKVTWQHVMLPEVEFMNPSQVVRENPWLDIQQLRRASLRGRLLAQRIAVDGRDNGTFRYPRLAFAFERVHQDEVDEQEIRAKRALLEKRIIGRFFSAFDRNVDPDGNITIRAAARLIGAHPKSVRAYNMHDVRGRIRAADLLSAIEWSKEVEVEPLSAGLFDPPFNTQWRIPVV